MNDQQLSREWKDLQPSSGESAEVLHLPLSPQQHRSLCKPRVQGDMGRDLALRERGWGRKRRGINGLFHVRPFAGRAGWERMLPAYPASCRQGVKLAQLSQLGNCQDKQLSFSFSQGGLSGKTFLFKKKKIKKIKKAKKTPKNNPHTVFFLQFSTLG